MAVLEETIDIAVIGAGHAGCEAALAAARMGLETVVFTVSVDSIAMMPCNPNIGGTSKGHLVKEIDALGGEMVRSRSCILKNAAPEAGAASVLQCVMRCRKNPIQNLF